MEFFVVEYFAVLFVLKLFSQSRRMSGMALQGAQVFHYDEITRKAFTTL